MNDEPEQNTESELFPAGEELEYKPAVKMAVGVLLLLVWGFVCFVFYHLGYGRGYDAGVGSGQVTKRAHDDALKTISYFLKLVSADDKTLLDTVKQHKESLAWVQDPAVREEALCMMLNTLLSRLGCTEQAAALYDEIVPPAEPKSPDWAAFMQKLARAYVADGKWDKAQAYYKCAEKSYADRKEVALWQDAARERAMLLTMGCGGETQGRIAELTQLLEQQKTAAPSVADVHFELLVMLGQVYREQGDHEASDKLMREALETPLDEERLGTTTLVCCGSAYLNLKDREKANSYFSRALDKQTHEEAPAHARPLYLAMALRELAMNALDEGRARDALDLLARAKYQASMLLPADNLFWLAVAEQQGWAFYTVQEFQNSLDVFRSGLKYTEGRDEKLRIRSLEGIARSCLALGRAEDAMPAVEECVTLREKHFPDQKESLGRVYMLLGQACDQSGQSARAAEAYAKAAAAMPEGHAGRLAALEAQAYSLAGAQQWEAAIGVLDTIIPLLPENDSDFREKVTAYRDMCRRKIVRETPQKVTPPNNQRARNTRRNTGRRRR